VPQAFFSALGSVNPVPRARRQPAPPVGQPWEGHHHALAAKWVPGALPAGSTTVPSGPLRPAGQHRPDLVRSFSVYRPSVCQKPQLFPAAG